GVVLLVGIGTFLYTQRPVVKAEGRWAEDLLIMENDSWKLQFSTPLKKETVTAENIYVKDSDGRDVNVTLKLSEDRKSLQVHAPNEGYP
ncbi:hypothetical protein R0K17_25125, partial [Planococcus sp. SIMBA_143]